MAGLAFTHESNLFACLPTCAASAVRVVMRNGDRISGEILAMAEGTLVVRTAYAGENTLAIRRPDSTLLVGLSYAW